MSTGPLDMRQPQHTRQCVENLGFKYRGKQVCEIGLMGEKRETGGTVSSDCGRADWDRCVTNLGKYTP